MFSTIFFSFIFIWVVERRRNCSAVKSTMRIKIIKYVDIFWDVSIVALELDC